LGDVLLSSLGLFFFHGKTGKNSNSTFIDIKPESVQRITTKKEQPVGLMIKGGFLV
jgi:hypothetical protein